MGGPWSFSPKQAAQLFPSAVCYPLKTGLNISFHLSEMEECWSEQRKIHAGFPSPIDTLLSNSWRASIATRAEVTSLRSAMSKSRPFSFWVQRASRSPWRSGVAAILEENVLREGRRLYLA